ncbi:hypothetical protein K431DRAFT_16914 [Polychaeton citri CBS 116435]|uniref:Uncharacterized protein n=1 Tax=Polychaeton citri CBS 116435 TaxID=1314669 RepID=A0A9P4QDJ2_9PEZI|nr:hypothetical protein K431DRAFT_16914 [Polychaeton citri CBS 116435]
MATTTSTSHRPVAFVGNALRPTAHPLLPSLQGPTSKSSRYLHILMSNMQQAKTSSPTKGQQMDAFYHRPTCTHLSVVRLYGPHNCQFCGRSASLGWVYVCREEDDEVSERRQSINGVESLPSVSDDSDYFESQAMVAESLNMSRSVVRGIREAQYSYDQIDRLIQQKEGLINAIWGVQNQIDDNGSCTSASSCSSSSTNEACDTDDIITHAGSVTSPAPSDIPIIVNGSFWPLPQTASNEILLPKVYSPSAKPEYIAEVKRPPGCGFQACHTCRPYVYERIFVSFESALNSRYPLFVKTDQLRDELPVYDANIVRNLGLREPHPSRSPRRWHHISADHHNYHLDDDYLSSEDDNWTPTSDESDMDDEPCPKCPGYGPCLGCGRGFARHYGMHGDTTIYQHSSSTYPYTSDAQQHLHRVDDTNHLATASPSQAPKPPSAHPSSSTTSLPAAKTYSTLTAPPLCFTAEAKPKESRKANSVCGVSGDDGKGALMRSSIQYLGSGRMASFRNSTVGEEVGVQGGVALTEEAVENYIPDIYD